MKLQIPQWDLRYENFKSRTVDTCHFVCVPNKSGMGLSYILNEPDGAAIYGIWCLILGACSTQRKPRNGYLTDTGTIGGNSWEINDLAIRFRRQPPEIARAISVLTSDKVGWLIDLDISIGLVSEQYPIGIPEENGREEKEENTPQPPKGEESNSAEQVPMGFEKFWAVWPQHRRKTARSQCLRKWTRGGCEAIAEQVIAALQRCKASGDWLKNQGEFIPAPLTWINQRRWEAPADSLQSDMGLVNDAEAYPGQSDEILRAADAMAGGANAH